MGWHRRVTSSLQSAMVLSKEPVTISFFPAAQRNIGYMRSNLSITMPFLSVVSKKLLMQDFLQALHACPSSAEVGCFAGRCTHLPVGYSKTTSDSSKYHLQAKATAQLYDGPPLSRTVEVNPPQEFLAGSTQTLSRRSNNTLPASDVTNAHVVAAWWPFSREHRIASRPCWSLPELEALCGLLTAASGKSNDECCTTFRTCVLHQSQWTRQLRDIVHVSLPSELKRPM